MSKSLVSSRLEKAFRRSGIHIHRSHDTVTVRRIEDGVSAAVLLPECLSLEEKAVKQLLDFASVHIPGGQGRVLHACATPDFHPGGVAPVGAVVATSCGFVIPAAVGTDISCGMRLVTTGLSQSQVESRKAPLLEHLMHVLLQNGRDVPMRRNAFAALFEGGAHACLDEIRDEGLWARVNRQRLLGEVERCIGLSEMGGGERHAPQALIPLDREVLRDPSLGTPGAGNHFVELQVVDAVLDRHEAWRQGLKAGDVVFMMHSGSRDVGFFVGQRWMDRARDAWPKGIRHPASGLYGLNGELAVDYLDAMGVAARYAWLNRTVMTEMVRDVFAGIFGGDESALVVDVPHNIILREHGMNIHRKGATPARAGDLALIPGSMGDYSYLAAGLGNADWLWSCSHGAGRSMRRQAARAANVTEASAVPWQCVTLREERRIEEAPAVYKRIGPVIEAQERAGLIRPVVRLRPWVTFKA